MPDRRYTILSTGVLPFERIPDIPDSVNIKVIPFTEILERRNDNLTTQIAAFSAKRLTVVFTSAYAVNIVAGGLKQKPEWKIYCIRNETRSAVVNWFGSESVIKFANNALGLSECIIDDGIKEAVFFCGDQRMEILPDNLIKHGVGLTELIVYDTRLTPVHVDESPDAILFFSPTAVRSFFSMNALGTDSTVFALGKTTAAALKEFTSNAIIVSSEPDKSFVLNLALDYAGSHPIT
jgi:uroporphyrinogen-III synthase